MAQTTSERLAVMARELQSVAEDVREIKKTIDEKYITRIEFKNLEDKINTVMRNQENANDSYVTKEEFRPYKRTSNIIGGVIVTAITTALAGLIIRK